MNMRGSIRKGLLCVVVELVLVVALTMAFSTRSAFSSPGEQKTYLFAPGDKLLITIFGHEGLSGEHTVDQEGNIQLPFGGPVRIGGATLEESQKRLKSALDTNEFLESPMVNVSIAELRPVFILGAVRRPGSFPYRFGMTVAQVIALAGGLGNIDRMGASVSDLIEAKQRVEMLMQRRRSAYIRLGRIEAELLSAKVLALPPEIKTDADLINRSMIKREQAVLLQLQKQHQNTVDAIQRQRPRVEAEIAALKKERSSVQRQADLQKERLEVYEDVRNRGLAKATTILTIQNAVAQFEGEGARIDARLSNLSQTLGELDIRLEQLESERALRLRTEEERLLTEVSEIEAGLPLAESLLGLRQSEVGAGVFASEKDVPYKIFLVRKEATNGDRTEVDFQQSVSPGDILDVRVALPKQDLSLLQGRRTGIKSMAADLLH